MDLRPCRKPRRTCREEKMFLLQVQLLKEILRGLGLEQRAAEKGSGLEMLRASRELLVRGRVGGGVLTVEREHHCWGAEAQVLEWVWDLSRFFSTEEPGEIREERALGLLFIRELYYECFLVFVGGSLSIVKNTAPGQCKIA